MLKRKAEKVLKEWLAHGEHTALCLLGARQTGKTTLAKALGNEYFRHTLLIDFIQSPQTKRIFENASNTEEILLGIQAYSSVPLIPKETLT